MKDLARRLPTTVVLIVFAYAAIRFLPVPYFSALLFLLVSLAAWELLRLTRPSKHVWPLAFTNGLLVALAFTVPWFGIWPTPWSAACWPTALFFLFTVQDKARLDSFARDWGILALSVMYLYFPLFFLLELKKLGPNYLFFLIFVIAVGDSGAYFVGSAIGKHKIYPVASPKKSLEGLIAAILTAGLSGWLSILLFPIPVHDDPGCPVNARRRIDRRGHRIVLPAFRPGGVAVQARRRPEGFRHPAAGPRRRPGPRRQLYFLRPAAVYPDPLFLEVSACPFQRREGP